MSLLSWSDVLLNHLKISTGWLLASDGTKQMEPGVLEHSAHPLSLSFVNTFLGGGPSLARAEPGCLLARGAPPAQTKRNLPLMNLMSSAYSFLMTVCLMGFKISELAEAKVPDSGCEMGTN